MNALEVSATFHGDYAATVDARGHTIDDTIAAHVAVLDAIREGNPKAAGAAMRAHLEDTERDIRSALNTRPTDPVSWGSHSG